MKKEFRVGVVAIALAFVMFLQSMPAELLKVVAEEITSFVAIDAEKVDTNIYSNGMNDRNNIGECVAVQENVQNRTSTTKEFLMSDNTIMVQQFAEPIHYYSNGEYLEIDNTIVDCDENGEILYKNRANSFEVKFNKRETVNESLVEIEENGYGFALRYISKTAKNSNIKIEEVEEKKAQDKKQKYNIDSKKNGNKGKVTYNTVDNNTDITYEIKSNRLTKNIIIKEKASTYDYNFVLTTSNLYFIQDIDGSILAKDASGKTKFVMSLPYMVDSNGEYSDAVKYILKNDGEKVELIVQAQSEWLNEHAKFPVTIIPEIKSGSKKNFQNTNIGESGEKIINSEKVYIGKKNGKEAKDAFFNFALPTVEPYYQLIGATVKFDYETKGMGGFNKKDLRYNVYMAENTRDLTLIDYNAKPKKIQNLNNIEHQGHYKEEKLTYESNVINTKGLGADATSLTIGIETDTGASDSSYILLATSEDIEVLYWYEYSIGIEDDYSMESFEIDSGAVYVNNATRKATAVMDFISVNTLSDFSLDVNIVYNDYYDSLLNEVGKDSIVGNNMKLNFQQFMIQRGNIFEMIDVDGSLSTFHPCGDGLYYSKEKGLYYNFFLGVVYDLEGNQLHFTNGRLTKIVSEHNLTEFIKICYENADSDKIIRIEYHANSIPKYYINFSYSEGRIVAAQTSIDAGESYKCALEYDEEGNLIGVRNKTGVSDDNATETGVQVLLLEYYLARLDGPEGILNCIVNNQKQGIAIERVNSSEIVKVYNESISENWQGRCNSYTVFDAVGCLTHIYHYENNILTNSKTVSFNNRNKTIAQWQQNDTGVISVTSTTNWGEENDGVDYEEEICSYNFTNSASGDLSINAGSALERTISASMLESTDNGYRFGVYFQVIISGTDDSIEDGINLFVKIGDNISESIVLAQGGNTYVCIPCEYYSENTTVRIENRGEEAIAIFNLTYAIIDSVYTKKEYDSSISAHRLSVMETYLTSGKYNIIEYDDKHRVESIQEKQIADNSIIQTTEYVYYDDDSVSSVQKGKIQEITVLDDNNNEIKNVSYSYTGDWAEYTETVVATSNGLKQQTSSTINRLSHPYTVLQTDENDITTEAYYKKINGDIRLWKVVYADMREEYEYNNLGQVIYIAVYEKDGSIPVYTQADNFDEKGVYIGSTYDGVQYSYTYDSTGYVTSIGQSNAEDDATVSPLVDYVYNSESALFGSNNVQRKSYANGNVESYSYSTNSLAGGENIVSLRHQNVTNGSIIGEYIYTYNIQGALKSQQYKVNGITEVSYAYGDLDDLKQQTLTIGNLDYGFQYVRQYDTLNNRMESATLSTVRSCTSKDPHTMRYSYDDGRLSKVSYDEFDVTYNYDELGRITNKSIPNSYFGVQDEAYIYNTYEKNGETYTTNQLIAIDDKLDSNRDRTAVYDSNGYVSEIGYNGGVYTYAYDSMGRLSWDGSTQYRYDDANNIIEKRSIYGVSLYEYNEKNQLTKINGEEQFSYDALGNPTVYKGNTFTWSQGRKLTSGNMNGKHFKYSYDGNGMRYEKVVHGVKTEYYYDGTRLLMENRNNTRIYYIYGATGVEGMMFDASYYGLTYFFDKNTLGDIVAIRNEEGDVVAQYEYDAWGNIIRQQGAMAEVNPFRYRGYYYDTETGFYYLQTRYYDPTICRFINADNYELIATLSSVPGQLNMYAYCNNNPIMYTDETGESITALLIGLGVAFLIGAGTSLVSQGIDKGWDSINYLQVCTDGLFAAAAVGLAYTGIGLGASVALGAGLGMTQYTFSAYAYGAEFSMDGLLFSGAMGALGGFISGAGAQNVKGLAGAILKDSGPTAVAMISGMRNLTGNMAFSNVVTQQFTQATYKINATTVLMPAITSAKNALKRFFVVD